MFEWLIDSIVAVITMILSWFGIDYAKIGSVEEEKKVEIMPHPEVIPDVTSSLP